MCPCSGVGYRRRNWSTSQNLSLSVYIFLLATFPFTFRFHFVINFFSYILIVDQSCFVLCLKKVEIYRKLAERCPLLVPVGIPDVISHYYILWWWILQTLYFSCFIKSDPSWFHSLAFGEFQFRVYSLHCLWPQIEYQLGYVLAS